MRARWRVRVRVRVRACCCHRHGTSRAAAAVGGWLVCVCVWEYVGRRTKLVRHLQRPRVARAVVLDAAVEALEEFRHLAALLLAAVHHKRRALVERLFELEQERIEEEHAVAHDALGVLAEQAALQHWELGCEEYRRQERFEQTVLLATAAVRLVLEVAHSEALELQERREAPVHDLTGVECVGLDADRIVRVARLFARVDDRRVHRVEQEVRRQHDGVEGGQWNGWRVHDKASCGMTAAERLTESTSDSDRLIAMAIAADQSRTHPTQ